MTGRQLEGHDPLELLIGNILRWGVILAAVVALIGVTMLIVTSGNRAEDFRHFTAAAATGIPGIVTATGHGGGRAVMELGVALLLLTPIVRVALSLFAFARERDRTFVLLTAVVLVLLLYGLLGGKV